VICESSRNTRGSQCFKCQGYGHIVAYCFFKNLLIKEDNDDEIETVVYELTDIATNSDDDIRISNIQLGVVRCLHTLLVMRIGVGLVCSTLILHMRGKL